MFVHVNLLKYYEENGIHLLFDCVFARSVWEAVGLSDLIQYEPNENVFDVLLRIFTQCTRNQTDLLAYMESSKQMGLGSY